MSTGFDRRKYWERKILSWESSRYGGAAWLKPGSWTLRRRLSAAAEMLKKVLPHQGALLDLGCGSGLLAERLRGVYSTYHGIDFAANAIEEARARRSYPGVTFEQCDVSQCLLPAADVTVFLGLVDWLEPEELPALFARISSPKILFSFTEAGGGMGPYGLYRAYYDARFGGGVYRARSYSWPEVRGWVGAGKAELLAGSCLDPGRLVLVER